MPPKLLNPSTGQPYGAEKKYRKPVVPYSEPTWISQYRLDRDICWAIQNGCDDRYSEEEVKRVKDIYFKHYQIKLI